MTLRRKWSLSEILHFVQLAIGLGIITFLIQIGEYKEKFSWLVKTVQEIKLVTDANAKDIAKCKNTIAAHTGKEIE